MEQGTLATVDELEQVLSRPTDGVLETMRRVAGDVIILGAAGKMGPTLSRMAKRAADQTGAGRRVIAVSRFGDASVREKLEAWSVNTIAGDLMDEAFVDSLPDAPNVIYMAGMKFGASGNESQTWAMNTLLPARVCRRYAKSRIAAFSTGNVYGMRPVCSGGSVEDDKPNPQGEYAMSCLGRERAFEYFSRTHGTPVSLLRLNYACELRYGVLVDLAAKILAGETIDLTMGSANVIWQRDANAFALQSLEHACSPPFVVNIAGPEQLSIRRVCLQLAQRMGKTVRFTGGEADDALLSNGQKGYRLFGYPTMAVEELIGHVADWVSAGRTLLGKPTKFEVRDGKF